VQREEAPARLPVAEVPERPVAAAPRGGDR